MQGRTQIMTMKCVSRLGAQYSVSIMLFKMNESIKTNIMAPI